MGIAPLDKCTVTGAILRADGTPLNNATVVFIVSGREHDGDVVVLPAPVKVAVGLSGNISARLWPNARGLAGTNYTATVYVTVGDQVTTYATWTLVVPDAPTANLADISDLVPADSVDDATAQVILARAARDEAREARDDAQEARDETQSLRDEVMPLAAPVAAVAAIIDDVTAVAGALPAPDSPDLSVEPTKLALRGNVEANFVARTPKRRFKTVPLMLADTATAYADVGEGDEFEAAGYRYRVAASDAADNHVQMAGGVKLYVLKSEGCWRAEAFGVVTGNYLTDAPGDKIDSAAALQAALDVLKFGDTLVLPAGTIYTRDITIPYGKVNLTIQGDGFFTAPTVIQFLDGATQGFRLGQEAYNFRHIRFRGVGDVEGAALFTSIRTDNRVDMDWQFFDCCFEATRHVAKMRGRGLVLDNCLFGVLVYDDAFILDYPDPADVIQEPSGYLGSLAGGFRGFTIRNSRIHGFYQHLFRVTGNNAVNARGFTIVGNQCDSYARVIKGYGNDVVFTGNNWYCGWNSDDACLFDLISGKGITITGNTISNSSTTRQTGDNPLVRATKGLTGLTIDGNTFVRRDVPLLVADLSAEATGRIENINIRGNVYDDCFVTAPCLVKLKGATGSLIYSVHIDETICGTPANWLAVDGDIKWRGSSVKVRMVSSGAKQHNIAGSQMRDNEPQFGAYLATGANLDVFVGYPPKIVQIYKNDGTFVGAKVANGLSAQPSTITLTATGFTASGAAVTSGAVYYWRAE
ncbi:MAG: hypothetical protein J0H34_22305 [Rhizobiales bacterium]|nr:hypothetical protein [Hyphomicrobiales bacterium]